MCQAESDLDKGLKDAAAKCWGDLEQQFERFFQDMTTLERAMDNNYGAERSKMLVHCDQIRQQTSALESKTSSIQDETKQLGENNVELAQEIAEQREELEMLRLRLASTAPSGS